MTRRRSTPDHLDRDTPDAPTTAGLRCPRCGGAPTLSVEDQSPTSPQIRFHAELRCCGLSADDSGPTAATAAKRATADWRHRHPEPPGDLSHLIRSLRCPKCAKALGVAVSPRPPHFTNRWNAVVECRECEVGLGEVAPTGLDAAEKAVRGWLQLYPSPPEESGDA